MKIFPVTASVCMRISHAILNGEYMMDIKILLFRCSGGTSIEAGRGFPPGDVTH